MAAGGVKTFILSQAAERAGLVGGNTAGGKSASGGGREDGEGDVAGRRNFLGAFGFPLLNRLEPEIGKRGGGTQTRNLASG